MPLTKRLLSPWLLVLKEPLRFSTQVCSRIQFSTRGRLRDVDSNLQPATRVEEPLLHQVPIRETRPVSKQTPEQNLAKKEDTVRLPRAVQAVYLAPLRRQAKYGVPSCDLQLRSYSVRNLEFFADFALRAAYYLKLSASGPVPLPQITERWTVPKSNFIFKKSQENFERKTLRRLIQIQDGHPDTVEIWLAFLRKHAYYGIGMKANIWNYNELGFDKEVMAKNPRSTISEVAAHGSAKASRKIEKAAGAPAKKDTKGAPAKAATDHEAKVLMKQTE